MLDIVVLAAGKGTRMKSSLPKVLHTVAGKSLLGHVLDTARLLGAENPLNVVVGHGADKVEQHLAASDVRFVLQEQQLGTGHAVQQTLDYLQDDSIVLILYGDVPLIGEDSLKRLIKRVDQNTMALLTVRLDDPSGYGRIIRNSGGSISEIVEQKDTSREQALITEVNTGVMAVRSHDLKRWLPELSNNNSQGEFYLTDIIAMASAESMTIHGEEAENEMEVLGVNNRQQQSQLERYSQMLQADHLMENGVTLLDPLRFDCRGQVTAGYDVLIDINCVFEGKVTLGNNVTIGPGCCIKNTVIGDNVVIKANSVIEDAEISNNCDIGPFARIRPGSKLLEGAKVGNFVETKKSLIGRGSKVNHLSYIGDAELGEKVNVGAGTITCNYDGVNKFKTTIGNNSFIGSNTALVAPVNVGDDATIGAGSTINQNVGDSQLAIARGWQKNIDGWEKPEKKT